MINAPVFPCHECDPAAAQAVRLQIGEQIRHVLSQQLVAN